MNKKLWLIPVIFLLLVSSVLGVPTAPDPADVVAEWRLENLTDTTYGGYDLTNNNAVTSGVAGIIDYAFSFSSGTDYLSVSGFSISSTYSISLWAKADSVHLGWILSGGAADPNYVPEIYFHSNGGIYFGGNRHDARAHTADSFYSADTWYHIFAVADGKNRYLYIDGSLEDSTVESNDALFYSTQFLGRRGGGTAYYLEGDIDEVIIFDVAYGLDEAQYLWASGSPDSNQQYDFTRGPTPDGDHSLETNVLFEQVSPVQVNSNTYQLVSSESFTPVNDTNGTLSNVIEITSSKSLEMQCKVLVDSVDYDTETSRTFDSASSGNLYITSSKFSLVGGASVDLELWCRRVSVTGGFFDVDKGVGIAHLLYNSVGDEINHKYISNDFGLTSSYVLLANTTFNTSNLSVTGLSRQLVFDGEIVYNYVDAGTISLYSVVDGVSSSVFNRYGTSGNIGNGGNFNIAFNVSNETSVPILIYGKSSSNNGGVNVSLMIKENIGHIGMFNVTGLNGTSLTSTTWATAKTIKLNNTDATGDIVVKASASTISTSGDQLVTYRLYYNGSEYSPEYERSIIDAGSGVSVLEYLFLDVGAGLFDVELQYKVESSASIVGGNLVTYMSGNVEAVPNNFLVNASNLWNGSAITSFNVTVNGGGTFFESNSSGVAIVTAVNPNNLTIRSDDYFDLFVLGHNTSNDYTAELYKSIININITERFSGNPITNWTLYNGSDILINTSSSVGVFYPNPAEFDNLLLHSDQGSFNDRSLDGFNVSLLDNTTIYYELLPTELNITAINILNSDSITNFSITYSSQESSHSGSYSTTSGELIFGVIYGDTYNITIDAESYALYNNSVLKLVSGNTAHQFSLYTNNSISFEVRWEENNTLITNNVSILLTGGITTYEYFTNNGTHYADDIVDDTYSIKASLAGYPDKYYSTTVADRSHQKLTIYFANDYDNVTFLFQDKNTGTTISGVYFSMSRYINETLTVVSSKLSDITGTVRTQYVPNTFYQISGLKTGYAVKVFELDPIESELYLVKMESSTSQVFIDDGVSIYYSPKTFVVDNNSFEFTINSPLGLLSEYWVNVSYPNSNTFVSGSESLGEIFDFDFSIVNPDIYDNVKVEYYYLNSLGESTQLVFYHPIDYINASAGAWSNLKGGYDDMGIFEKIMIVVLAVVLVSGFGYLVGGVSGSLISGLLVYVLFVASGFIPLWSILISLFVGLVLVMRGGVFG